MCRFIIEQVDRDLKWLLLLFLWCGRIGCSCVWIGVNFFGLSVLIFLLFWGVVGALELDGIGRGGDGGSFPVGFGIARVWQVCGWAVVGVGTIFGSIVDFFGGGVWAGMGGLLQSWGCCSLDCLMNVGLGGGCGVARGWQDCECWAVVGVGTIIGSIVDFFTGGGWAGMSGGVGLNALGVGAPVCLGISL